MKKCARCIMPETKLGISFNKGGVCNACQNVEFKKKIDYVSRAKKLKDLALKIKRQKPNGYNCLIPASGGKDSSFLAMYAREKLGLNPLLVFVEPAYITERGKKNINNLSSLGFDTFVFKPNQKILPSLLKRSFIEDGQPVRAFEFMLYSVPMRVAINFNIPLVMWGENSRFEYGNIGDGKDQSAAAQNCYAVAAHDANVWIGKGVNKNDLISFQHPTDEELKKAGVTAIYLGDYIYWDSRKTADFAIKHGLTIRPKSELLGTGGYWDFEQLDDEMPILSHLFKYAKFGYGRATDQACRDIREGYITRKEGLKLAKKYDGHCNPDYIKRYCKYIGITEKYFWQVVNKFRNKKIFHETIR